MSRFLSPAKLCLILLIDIYHDGEVQLKDTIQILSFISERIIRRNEAADDSNDQFLAPSSLALASFQALLSPLASNFPGRSLYDVFLSSIWALDSFEQLDTVFEKVSRRVMLL